VTRVVDASVVISALLGVDDRAGWAEAQLLGEPLVAPHLLPAEVANLLRRNVMREEIPRELAAIALDDLADLPITFYAAEPLLTRIWALRDDLTAYDAWYVALAESLDVPLATLDMRLAGAAGPVCEFRTPS
jgi:predicted nucleic acid-binding protein